MRRTKSQKSPRTRKVQDAGALRRRIVRQNPRAAYWEAAKALGQDVMRISYAVLEAVSRDQREQLRKPDAWARRYAPCLTYASDGRGDRAKMKRDLIAWFRKELPANENDREGYRWDRWCGKIAPEVGFFLSFYEPTVREKPFSSDQGIVDERLAGELRSIAATKREGRIAAEACARAALRGWGWSTTRVDNLFRKP